MIARYLIRQGMAAAGASAAATPVTTAVAARSRCRSSVAVAANSCGKGKSVNSSIMRGLPALNQVRYHGGPSISADAPTIKLTFVNPPSKTEGEDAKAERLVVDARVGETLLQVAHRNHIEVEGACEGVCACSTCHVILSEDLYDKLADEWDQEASEDEEDMLDMAFGLTGTSRLGCQVTVAEEMEGEEIQLPSATRNFYVDGHVPQPH